jgi:hypothetical protein
MDIRCPPHTLQIFSECFRKCNLSYLRSEDLEFGVLGIRTCFGDVDGALNLRPGER